MKDYLVSHIPLEQVDKNPLNPQARGEPADIKALMHSIVERGLYYPILVNKKDDGRYLIVEGHRRYAVYEWKKQEIPDFAAIPALVINVGNEYITAIFREINETSKKLTGKQWLEVFALGGKVKDLPSRLSPAIEALGGLFTAEELHKIARRQGPSVHGLARRVAKFCDYNPDDHTILREIVAWLVGSGDSVNVRVAMEEAHVEKVKTAIAGKRKIDGSAFPDGEIVPYASTVTLAAVA
jgi:hypothetical protein